MGDCKQLNTPPELTIYQVAGNSMNPLLLDGQMIKVQSFSSYEVGDTVVAMHPIQTNLIVVKQVKSIEEKGLRLQGVNRKETSDNFGIVKVNMIKGKVIKVVKK